MTKPIYVINGPNLDRLGKREPHIYGSTTLAEVEAMCREAAGSRSMRFVQSNTEGWHRDQPGRLYIHLDCHPRRL